MIEVREMTTWDLSDVAQIEQAIFSEPWSKEAFGDSLRQPGTHYLTARLDGELAGYCGMLQCTDEADITNVAVKEDCRKRGVAYRMLRELLRAGEEKGVKTFFLEVRQSNHAAKNLYEKLGFQYCGVRKNFYEKPREDAALMCRKAGSPDAKTAEM